MEGTVGLSELFCWKRLLIHLRVMLIKRVRVKKLKQSSEQWSCGPYWHTCLLCFSASPGFAQSLSDFPHASLISFLFFLLRHSSVCSVACYLSCPCFKNKTNNSNNVLQSQKHVVLSPYCHVFLPFAQQGKEQVWRVKMCKYLVHVWVRGCSTGASGTLTSRSVGG